MAAELPLKHEGEIFQELLCCVNHGLVVLAALKMPHRST